MDKTVFYDVSYGVYVVTTSYQNKNVGCIANSFCQITSVDNIVSISLNKQNYTNEAIKNTKKFALSIISEQTNSELIGKFGFYSSPAAGEVLLICLHVFLIIFFKKSMRKNKPFYMVLV